MVYAIIRFDEFGLFINFIYHSKDDLRIRFASSRPERMILEVSRDFGATWEVLQYYDSDCTRAEYAEVASSFTTANPTAVICISEYSQLVSTKGYFLYFRKTRKNVVVFRNTYYMAQ